MNKKEIEKLIYSGNDKDYLIPESETSFSKDNCLRKVWWIFAPIMNT
ncbi:MAG: hypothetical protein HOM15_12685 [Gammaproteobacteria bacterium]|nr:hypothetical protein [Gammaproteobacteria bacterium]MBT5825493.1 hypothetical protein [Gammaproteobacteria bacterium]MBT6419394.1 hypothetical protein [Gammaproteobacteria bacterium]